MSDLYTQPQSMDSRSTNRVSGVVKFYSVQKCYGFIKRDDTKECVFVHSKSIMGKNKRRVSRSLAKGEHVEFDVMASDRSPEAINVTGIDGEPVVGSEYGWITMQWYQFNGYKKQLIRNGCQRSQSPRGIRFFHRRPINSGDHGRNRNQNQHQHHNQRAAGSQQRSANEATQNPNDYLDENKPKTRRRHYNQDRRTRPNNDNDNDNDDHANFVLEMTESNVTTLLSGLNINNENATSAHSTSSESLDFEKIHNDESNPIPCITSIPATFTKGNQ